MRQCISKPRRKDQDIVIDNITGKCSCSLLKYRRLICINHFGFYGKNFNRISLLFLSFQVKS